MSIERRHKPAWCCLRTPSLFPAVRKKRELVDKGGNFPSCSSGLGSALDQVLGHSPFSLGWAFPLLCFCSPWPSFWTTFLLPFKSNSSWAIPSPLLPGRPFPGSAHHDYPSSLCPLAPAAGPMCPTQPSMYINTVLGPGRVGSAPRISQKKKKRKPGRPGFPLNWGK